MFSRNRDEHHESGTVRRNRPDRSQRPRCVFSKEPRPDHDGRRRGINISGVDFWHAVEFSRNGRFLCTHPLGLSSGRFPSVFQTLSVFFRPSEPPSCRHAEGDPKIGSDKLVAARPGHEVASLSPKQEYDCTRGCGAGANRFGVWSRPLRGAHAEPALQVTYAAEQCAARYLQGRPYRSPPLGGFP
jgi:hypothetical protein